MSVTVDVKELLKSGAHFGHKTSRWHPKMAPYIHSKRGESHIIDLTQTAELLETALAFVAETVGSGKQVLLVGTKRQAQEVLLAAAEKTGMPYVTNRWLGGMLTNLETMNARIKRLKSLEEKMASGELAAKYNKLEVQRFQEEMDKLNFAFGGVKDMAGRPGAVFIVDVQTDAIAVKEARKLHLPVIGLVDSNVDPTPIDYPVPCNDDAIKPIALVVDYLVQAIEAGKGVHAKKVAVKQAADDKAQAAAAKAAADEERKTKRVVASAITKE